MPARRRSETAEKAIVDARISVDLPETSDVTLLARGRFFVVSDKKARGAIVEPDGATTVIDLAGIPGKRAGLEACAFAPGASGRPARLWVFAEESRILFAYRWSGEPGDEPTLVDRRELAFGDLENKGVEGLVWLDAAASPTGEAGLLLANEGAPRAIHLLPDEGGAAIPLAIDGAIFDACGDFSGLAYDVVKRTVLLVSDESSALVEARIEPGPRLAYVRARSLVDESGELLERVEGVVVDASDRTWVLLEDERALCRVG